MALNIPDTAEEIDQRAKTDVRRSWAGSNPFLKNSGIAAVITSFSNRIFDFYLQLKEGIKQSFPDTATGTFLERWASIFGKTRLAATKATGFIVVTGTDATLIPLATLLATQDGLVYESTSSVSITATSISVSSITRIGTTVTVITETDHGLASNVETTIVGANQSEYNGVQTIQVTSVNSFTFEISTTPTTPATGTITAEHTSIQVPVTSQDFQNSSEGINVNQLLDTPLSLQSPIIGVDTVSQVDFETLGGGSNQEVDSDLRVRMLQRIQNPVAHFNVSDIDEKSREVNGVTRVFVKEVTPAVGQVTIYFMRDNDVDPIPSAGEVTDVKNSILEIKPANTIDADVIVTAPTAVPTAFTFSSLTPNTTAMQTAITANLEQFFSEETSVNVNVRSEEYISAIQNTIDESGTTISEFTLSAPTGDIAISTGEIATFDGATYP